MAVDPQKLLDSVRRYMAQRIAYAESPSRSGGPIYASMGFSTPEAFCAARDESYQLLVQLLTDAAS